ncbi:MAG: ATP-NAD kinase family protein [Promethearchaeota archaeon]
MKKIGLIINPIAGMGGSVGLKGTDGDIYKKALKLGASPVAPKRISQFLSNLKSKEDLFLLVAPGKMGEDYVKKKGFAYEIIGEIKRKTTADDTKRISNQMVEKSIELLVFCGGDGTARDIYDAIGMAKPVVAIPSGVKMFSSVFALNPRAGAEIIDKFLKEAIETLDKEILDINEESYQRGILDSRLYGYLKVPKVQNLIQAGKDSSNVGRTDEVNKYEIAQHMIENMQNDILYLLGPGTTIKTIADHLKIPKTLLGIDAIYNKELIGRDLNEKGILELLNEYKKVEVILTPIGGQGFILGRGNKQITPKILQIIGKKNLKIIATEEKMKGLNCLRVDTGDIEVDKIFEGPTKVIVGYKQELVVEILI